MKEMEEIKEDPRLRIYGSTHQYFKKGERYASVSSVLDRYKDPYNKEYWSLYKGYQAFLEKDIADKDSKAGLRKSKEALTKTAKAMIKKQLIDYSHSPENEDLNIVENVNAIKYLISKAGAEDFVDKEKVNILSQWQDSGDSARLKGNTYHRSRELKSFTKGYELNAFDNETYKVHTDLLAKQYNYDFNDGRFESIEEGLMWHMDHTDDKYAISDNYYLDLEDGFYPELLLHSDQYKVAGTADRIFIKTILGERFVDVDDYKTNKVIDKKSFYIRGRGYKMLHPPIGHLMDCKHVRYHLQVSMYARMLEGMGFTVRNVGYHHLNTLFNLDYLKDDVENVLMDYYDHTYGKVDNYGVLI